MSDYIEVSLVILGESRDDDIYKQIVEEINKVNGKIVAISHTTGTNVIDVSAHWDEPEIGRKIEQIKRIANVKHIIRPCKVKISNHCYDDKQIDSAISVCVAIYIYFFYKENNHRNFQFYL